MVKSVEAENEFSGIRPMVASRWRALAALAALAVAGGTLEAAFLVTVTRTGVAVADGADTVTITRSVDMSATAAVGTALVLILLRFGVAVLAAWQSARVSTSLTRSLRMRLASSFLRASWAVQHDSPAGKLQELLTTFAQQGNSLIGAVTRVTSSGFSLLALVTTAVAVDPRASLLVLGASAVLGLALRPLRSAIRRQSTATAETGMSFATSLAEVSQIGLEMHIFNVQEEVEESVASLIEQHETRQRRLRFLQGLVPALYTGLAYVAIVAALAVLSTIDGADLGSVGAVMLIMLRSLSYGQAIQTSAAAIQAATPFLSTLQSETRAFRSSQRPRGAVTEVDAKRVDLQSVSFAYPGGEAVLHDLSLSIGPNEVVGVIGPSGSGKSTLVQLLLGLRMPSAGNVTASGLDLGEISAERWARLATFVPQEAHIVSGTIKENIAFMRPNVTLEQVKRAATLAGLHDEILAMPDGYNQRLGGQSSSLSGGQRQRLIIARALVEEPDLLILDEPTSALDVRSEAAFRASLRQLRSRMTMVIIAHRLTTLDVCDRIMVIQEGRLRAFDTPERLKETSDFYREALTLSELR